MFSSLINKLFNASFSPSWDLCRPDIAVSFLNSLALIPHPLWSLNFPSLCVWGEVRLTLEVIWRWMNLPQFVGFHFCHCGGTIWSSITLFFTSLSFTSISVSPSTQHTVCLCICVFVFTEEPVCWFLVYVIFVFCLARSLTEQIKSLLFLRERTEKEQKNCLSVRRIDSLVIHRYSLQQFQFSLCVWITGFFFFFTVLFWVIQTPCP